MSKVILLTGEPGVGKTTLMRRVIGMIGHPAGGFYTREIRSGKQRVGFEIVTLDGKTGLLAHVDIPSKKRISRYGVDTTALEKIAIPAIMSAADNNAIVVIDELGPMEFFSEIFCQTVFKILQGNATVLASIVKRPTPISERIKSLPGIIQVEVTRQNRDHLAEWIRDKISS
jgi:nucleoside-triphosphatase